LNTGRNTGKACYQEGNTGMLCQNTGQEQNKNKNRTGTGD